MYLLFDIGGTKIRLALTLDGKTLGEPQIIETPQSFDVGMSLFEQSIKGLGVGGDFKTAVGGVRGTLDKSKSKVIKDFILPGWVGKPLKQELERIIGVPQVYLENDADLAGLGEAISGAGRGFDIVAYVTVSTGVGGVRIVNGEIDVNSSGFEPGYQVIDADASIDSSFLAAESRYGNNFAYLQRLVSGKDFENRFGKQPQETSDEKIWNELAKLLAIGLNNTIVHWSPDVVILGGSMMKTPGISIEEVKLHLSNILKIFPQLPEIKEAQLGDAGGLHGALAYLKHLR